jgi:hypothetical protein
MMGWVLFALIMGWLVGFITGYSAWDRKVKRIAGKGIPMTIDNKEYVVFEADFGKEQVAQKETKHTVH